jgi:hypothetical protein
MCCVWVCIYMYKYSFLVSCIVDIIHAECGNILILLYSRMEFYFCWFDTDQFLYKIFELLYSTVGFILVIRILIAVVECSA